MGRSSWRKTISQNQDLILLLGVFLGWLVVRNLLKAFLCTAALCWLEPSHWPALLGIGPETARLLVAAVALALFAAPTGWASIIATVVGIDLLLGHGFSLSEATALFSISTAISLMLTWKTVSHLLGQPGPVRKWLAEKAKIASRRIRLEKNAGTFWLLAFGNAVSSQIHLTALAQVLRVPFGSAFPPLFLGSLFSFFIPVVAFFTARAFTLDGVSAVLLGLSVFGAVRHLATRAENPTT